MKGHAIASIVWVGLLAGGWYAFEHLGRSTPAVRGCDNGGAVREIVVDAARDGHYYLEGAVNDVPVRFLVDTGASYVTVGPARGRAGPDTGRHAGILRDGEWSCGGTAREAAERFAPRASKWTT